MQPLANNPALRPQLETQLSTLTELAQKSYDMVLKLSELNLHLAQQMVEDTLNASRELMACSDPFQFTSIAMRQVQPAAEHLRSYQQQLVGVISGAQVELARAAEAQQPALRSFSGQRPN
jgi:phasin family protein